MGIGCLITCTFYNILWRSVLLMVEGPSWPWLYGSWIYNYLCNQCPLPPRLWVRISIRARCTTLCDKVCKWLATGRCFSVGPPVSFTNKTDRHDITEILLKVTLNTIKQTTDGGKHRTTPLTNIKWLTVNHIMLNHIGGVMVSVLASSVVDRGWLVFLPRVW